MKPLQLFLLAAAAVCIISSCAYTIPNGGASVEASNGLMRGANGSVIPTAAGGGAVASPLADERARKSEAWNKLSQ